MGHRVPPAISRYIYKYIYICIYFFFSRSHNVEEMKKRKKTRLHARNIWFITWIIQNEIYSKRNKGHDRTSLFEFFFFFSMLPPGNIRRGKCSLFTWNISVFEFNIVSLILRIGNFFKSPEIFFFFPDENPVFFFPSATEILIKQFICDGNCRRNGIGIVFQFIHISFADLLVNSIVKKKKKKNRPIWCNFQRILFAIFLILWLMLSKK